MLGSEWTRDADASITQWVRCARRSGAALQGLRCTKCRAMHEVSCDARSVVRRVRGWTDRNTLPPAMFLRGSVVCALSAWRACGAWRAITPHNCSGVSPFMTVSWALAWLRVVRFMLADDVTYTVSVSHQTPRGTHTDRASGGGSNRVLTYASARDADARRRPGPRTRSRTPLYGSPPHPHATAHSAQGQALIHPAPTDRGRSSGEQDLWGRLTKL